jgi:hypothetical protein
MARRRLNLRSPALVAWVATVLIVLSVGSVMWLKVLPECWRDNPTWSAGQCVDDFVRRGGPFAPPRPPAPKPVVPPTPQLTLTWMDNSGGDGGFRIERKTGAAGTYAMLAEVPPGTTSYVDATVASGTTYCYRVKAFNEIGESSFSNENCGSAASGFGLAVNVSGSGTVTSSPAGISCAPTCSGSFTPGTLVTLAASPAAGSQFTGWSGGGCSGTAPCSLTGSGPVSITATFGAAAGPPPPPPPSPPPPPPPPATYSLTVTRSGQGTVVSSPAGISCGADCAESYTGGTPVTLSALPGSGWTFSGWTGGGCSGTAPCTVTVAAASTVTATFATAAAPPPPPAPPPPGAPPAPPAPPGAPAAPPAPATYALNVSRSGQGRVMSQPGGINCGSDCSESYPSGTRITLSADPSDGWKFTGWSGSGCSGTAACTVTLSAARSVSANFARDRVKR